jgi:nucleoside-diphosphate-sugar epimerase
MRMLVIGGNGFIGSPLVRELTDSGHQVAILHRRAAASAVSDRVLSIRADRNSLADHRKEFEQFAPDVVIDLILSSGEQARQLVNAFHDFTLRIVVISSMDVYRAWGVLHGVEPGALEPLPLTEDSPVRTVRQLYPPEAVSMMQSIFSWLDDRYDKIAVEEAIMNDARISGTVLRLPMVYGPGDPLLRFFPLLKRIADGRSSILLPDDLAAWRGPRGYVENIAHAIAIAATSNQAAGRIYNVHQEPTLSELEWQKTIAAELKWKGQFIVLPRERTPMHLLLPGNAAQHVVCSSARIRSELGFKEPITTDEAIRRTIAWEQANPPAVINPSQFNYDAEDSALAGSSASLFR